jgi:diguanylate cyclase (GGDEF)-like protein
MLSQSAPDMSVTRPSLRQLLTREDLAMLAGQDGLTGLPNRTLLRTRLNKGIVQMRRGDTVLAFHCLDLDHFKFNGNLGHPVGDALLKLVAGRLTSILRIGDTVARVRGVRSAQAARRSNVTPSGGANAMPTVTPMRTSRPSITKGVPSARDSVRKYARLVFAVDSSLQHDKFVGPANAMRSNA